MAKLEEIAPTKNANNYSNNDRQFYWSCISMHLDERYTLEEKNEILKNLVNHPLIKGSGNTGFSLGKSKINALQQKVQELIDKNTVQIEQNAQHEKQSERKDRKK